MRHRSNGIKIDHIALAILRNEDQIALRAQDRKEIINNAYATFRYFGLLLLRPSIQR